MSFELNKVVEYKTKLVFFPVGAAQLSLLPPSTQSLRRIRAALDGHDSGRRLKSRSLNSPANEMHVGHKYTQHVQLRPHEN